MSYGLIVRNNNNYIQIDSDNPRLCAIYSGNYQATSDEWARVTFPSPIITTEPPCIFVRNSESRPNDTYYQMIITGSANNWTGFQIMASNVLMRPLGKWFCAVFASVSQATWGLRMWSASGTIIYDSGATPIVVTKASNSWTYQGQVTLVNGNAYYYRSNLIAPIASDEYFMINPFSRGLLAPGQVTWNPSAVRYNYAESCLQLYAVGTQAWIDIGAPGTVYARLPGV